MMHLGMEQQICCCGLKINIQMCIVFLRGMAESLTSETEELNLAKGKFLLFADSDDIMEVDKVIRLAQENDFDLLVYSFYQWKNNERIDGRSLRIRGYV